MIKKKRLVASAVGLARNHSCWRVQVRCLDVHRVEFERDKVTGQSVIESMGFNTLPKQASIGER